MNDGLAIRHERHAARGRYVLAADGLESELTYALAGDRLIIDHTYVPPPQRGAGRALALVTHAVADARARGLKIQPVCSYARAEIERRPEWHDVLAP